MVERFQNQALLLLFMLLTLNSFGQETNVNKLWLSGEAPPAFQKIVKKSGMQHYYVIPGKRGAEKLVLWVREGENFQNSKYRNDSLLQYESIVSMSPSKTYDIHKLEKLKDSSYVITYPFKEEGYHNLYLISKKVQGDTLFVHSAKAERLSHKCRFGHKHILDKIKANFTDEIPFEIGRQRIDYEDLHLMLKSGQKLQLEALKYGQALPGANLSITSQKGWTKKVVTDEKGKVTFQIISDHFSQLQDIEKKHISRMLITARYDEKMDGQYEGSSYNNICYTSSLELDYIPSPLLYKSKIWSVFVILLSITVLSVLLFLLLRRKRNNWNKILNYGS